MAETIGPPPWPHLLFLAGDLLQAAQLGHLRLQILLHLVGPPDGGGAGQQRKPHFTHFTHPLPLVTATLTLKLVFRIIEMARLRAGTTWNLVQKKNASGKEGGIFPQ